MKLLLTVVITFFGYLVQAETIPLIPEVKRQAGRVTSSNIAIWHRGESYSFVAWVWTYESGRQIKRFHFLNPARGKLYREGDLFYFSLEDRPPILLLQNRWWSGPLYYITNDNVHLECDIWNKGHFVAIEDCQLEINTEN